jgi:1-acyl-sn-glycerol-3-phosphate acyltransferase
MSDFTIENYEKVYEHFRDYRQNQKFVHGWYSLNNFMLRPRVHYAKGARKDLDLIRDKEYHHIYVFNHQDDWDGYVCVGLLDQVAPYDVGQLRPMVASQNYQGPLLFKAFRGIGGIPVFLRSHYAEAKKHRNHPERLDLVSAATAEALDCLADVMIQHRQKVLIFPEGRFNNGAPDTILPIFKGASIIAHRVAQVDSPVAITSVGLAYGKKRRRFTRPGNASGYVNRSIFVTPDMTIDEITELISKQLLNSVQHAVKLY